VTLRDEWQHERDRQLHLGAESPPRVADPAARLT
jgi:hypothetical protein